MQRTESYTLAPDRPNSWAGMPPGVVYLDLRGEPEDRFAFFLCPCGCERQIMLNFAGHRQNWSYGIHADGSISFSPSISLGDGCRSHFHIRHGLVEWC